jgi:antitoxin Phd
VKSISATDAKQRFAAVIDAAQREPVRIRRQNRDVAVVMSPAEYDRIRGENLDELDRLSQRVSKQAAESGMSEKILADILNAAVKKQPTRLGFMTEQISVPDDFDHIGRAEIERLFTGEE